MDVEEIWEEHNKKRGGSLPLFLVRTVLRILSYFFLLAYYLRALLYKFKLIKSKRLKAKVISVGNITLGGTGKTPLVIYIGKRLKKQDENFAILTRGYKRKNKKMVEIPGEKVNWQKVGDEPYMLSSELPDVPIFINKNRYRAGKEALRKHKTRIFILDDGFQHWRLERDVNIMMIDCLNPFGGGRLFPAGFLREPLSALKRADLFVLNRVDQVTNIEDIKQVLNKYNPDALKVESLYLLDSIKNFLDNSLVDVEALKGKGVAAFSGIANSLSFEKTLDQLRIKTIKHFEFSDHFPYREEDISKLEEDSLNLGAQAILTTEKDAVRIPKVKHLRIPLYVIKIKLKMTKGEENFWKAVGIS